MVLRRRETGGDQHRAEFVAIKTGGVRLVVEPRPTDVDGRGVIDEPFFLGVTEETCDGAESSGHCGPGLAFPFEIMGERPYASPGERAADDDVPLRAFRLGGVERYGRALWAVPAWLPERTPGNSAARA